MVGFDGKMLRFHIIPEDGDFHPSQLSSACSDNLCPFPLQKYHTYCSCSSYFSEGSLLAIGGCGKYSLSVWKIVENPPYYQLLSPSVDDISDRERITVKVSVNTKLLFKRQNRFFESETIV